MTQDNYECRACHGTMYVPDGMDPLEEDVRYCSDCMVVELERLQGIVGRRPKTADGITIELGMTVWAWIGNRLVNTEVYEITLSHCGYDRHVFRHGNTYSTSEAAEKARQP
jgi:hypothetical protein